MGSLTTGQAAKLCSVTPDTVLKWVRRGWLSATRTAGGHYRVALSELEPFLAKLPPRSDRDHDNGGGDEPYCWEFHSGNGVAGDCKKCIVYRSHTKKCYLLVGLGQEMGHSGLYCKTECSDCGYYGLLRQRGLVSAA